MKTPYEIVSSHIDKPLSFLNPKTMDGIYLAMTEYAMQFKTERDSLKEQVEELKAEIATTKPSVDVDDLRDKVENIIALRTFIDKSLVGGIDVASEKIMNLFLPYITTKPMVTDEPVVL